MSEGAKTSANGGGFRFKVRGPRDFYGGLALIALAHSWWFGIPVGVVVLSGVLVLIFGTRLGRWTVGIAALIDPRQVGGLDRTEQHHV